MPVSPARLHIQGMCKAFAGVPVLVDVDLTVDAGEIVALLGENGAGKSTLVKIISGVYTRDAGTLALDGVPARFSGVRAAEDHGVVLVAQELHIAPNLSIAENMFMGALPRQRCGFIDQAKLHTLALERLAFFGIDTTPDTPMHHLSPSAQRLVMIAAALFKPTTKVLILDEPTAALTPSEALNLFTRLRQIRQKNVACIYITHRLDEIAQIADRVVVMRNGRVAATFTDAQASLPTYVHAMIGRDVAPPPPPQPCAQTQVALRVRDLCVYEFGHLRCRAEHINFTLHRGEILGVFGLIGAGRTEMAQAIFGAWRGPVSGEITIAGRLLRPRSPAEAIAAGIAMLTEDRKRTGLIERHSVSHNISAASLHAVAQGLFIDERAEITRNQALIEQLDLRPARLDLNVEAFSGGNQQKVLLARWIATQARVLIVDEPTLGVDIGARYEIYQRLRNLVNEGAAVLMISSDVNEILSISDRVLVMHAGRITAMFARPTQHQLMVAANGEITETATGTTAGETTAMRPIWAGAQS